MKNEILIKESGYDNGIDANNKLFKTEVGPTLLDTADKEKNGSDPCPQQRGGIGGEDISNIAGGKKLNGTSATVIAYPSQFRYRMIRYNEQSAVVKQWESQALLISPSVTKDNTQAKRDIPDENTHHSTMLDSRCFFSRSRGYPSCLHSIIAYTPEAEKARLAKQAQYSLGADVYKVPQRDWRGTSYRQYFQVRRSH